MRKWMMAVGAMSVFGLTAVVAPALTAPIRYAAIGDSYSIGEGATPEQSWPVLLARDLIAAGIPTELVANPSVTGWTTRDALDRELPIFLKAKPNFATLQIGVNDWVRGVDEGTFRKQLTELMDKMLSILLDKHHLLIVNIPDFSVTPAGARYAKGRDIAQGLARFNEIIRAEADKRGLKTVDISPLSKMMGKDRALIAEDGLHPSAREYAAWEKIIFPVAESVLKTKREHELRTERD